MKPKDSRLIMKIESDLKRAIDRFADKKNITTSQYCREVLTRSIATKEADKNDH